MPADGLREYEYDIRSLLGELSDLERRITIPLDLKTKFGFIENVDLLLEGIAYPGIARLLASVAPEFEMTLSFTVSIAERFAPGTGDLRTPVAVTGPLSAGAFSIRRPFAPRHKRYASDWTFLQDGRGELELSWGLGCADGGCRTVTYSTVQVTQAVLIVSGHGNNVESSGPGRAK